ncbi:MAG: ABC transporter substrate-binding protein [Thermomicrobiales bacterium]
MDLHDRTLRKSINRRRLVAGAAALVAARSARARAQDNIVRMLCWGGYDAPAATQTFRDETGFEIHSTIIGANDEIFLRMRARGPGRYDLVTPQNGVVRPLAEAGLIQPIDVGRLTRIASLLPAFQQPDWAMVDDQVYAVPYLWGAAPMVYNADLLARPPARWLDLQSDDYRGLVAMHDDGLGHLRIWNRVLGAEDPVRVTTSRLADTTELLISIKARQVMAFSPDMGAIAGILARGEASIATVGWPAVPTMEIAQDADLRLAYPQPGAFSFCDSFCLATGAPNVDAAYALIDHMLSPEAQGTVSAAVVRGVVNRDAVPLLDPALRGLHPYDNLDPFFELNPLLGFPPVHDDDSGIASYVDWVNAWERVRYARMDAD